MTATAPIESALELPCYVAGEPVVGSSKLEVHYPYTGEVSGIVSMLGRKELDAAIAAALAPRCLLPRDVSCLALSSPAGPLGNEDLFPPLWDPSGDSLHQNVDSAKAMAYTRR